MNRLFYIHWVKQFITNYKFKGKKYLNRFLEYLTPKMKDNIIVKTKYGIKLKISPILDKGIERAIFNRGVYEEGTLWCFKKILKKNYTVIDAGANIGLTSIFASKLVGNNGKVYAFEPMPETYKILCFNIHLNKLKNILAINLGLSDFEGEAEIYDNLHINRGAASLYTDRLDKGTTVKITTIDKFLAKYEFSEIDFIKIDIEGSELSMLKGCKDLLNRGKNPMICVEFSRDVKSNHNPELLFLLLKETYSYRVFKQMKGKESMTPLIEVCEIKDLPIHDNLYCFQSYHLEFLPKDLFLIN